MEEYRDLPVARPAIDHSLPPSAIDRREIRPLPSSALVSPFPTDSSHRSDAGSVELVVDGSSSSITLSHESSRALTLSVFQSSSFEAPHDAKNAWTSSVSSGSPTIPSLSPLTLTAPPNDAVDDPDGGLNRSGAGALQATGVVAGTSPVTPRGSTFSEDPLPSSSGLRIRTSDMELRRRTSEKRYRESMSDEEEAEDGEQLALPDSSSQRSGTSKGGMAAFVYKVYDMLENPAVQALISFSEDGKAFEVHNIVDFSAEVLPKYFKHSNFSSFVRQLNMYGFRKVSKGPRPPKEADLLNWEFRHPIFERGRRDLLYTIKRRGPEDDSWRRRERKKLARRASTRRGMSSEADTGDAVLEGDSQLAPRVLAVTEPDRQLVPTVHSTMDPNVAHERDTTGRPVAQGVYSPCTGPPLPNFFRQPPMTMPSSPHRPAGQHPSVPSFGSDLPSGPSAPRIPQLDGPFLPDTPQPLLPLPLPLHYAQPHQPFPATPGYPTLPSRSHSLDSQGEAMEAERGQLLEHARQLMIDNQRVARDVREGMNRCTMAVELLKQLMSRLEHHGGAEDLESFPYYVFDPRFVDPSSSLSTILREYDVSSGTPSAPPFQPASSTLDYHSPDGSAAYGDHRQQPYLRPEYAHGLPSSSSAFPFPPIAYSHDQSSLPLPSVTPGGRTTSFAYPPSSSSPVHYTQRSQIPPYRLPSPRTESIQPSVHSAASEVRNRLIGLDIGRDGHGPHGSTEQHAQLHCHLQQSCALDSHLGPSSFSIADFRHSCPYSNAHPSYDYRRLGYDTSTSPLSSFETLASGPSFEGDMPFVPQSEVQVLQQPATYGSDANYGRQGGSEDDRAARSSLSGMLDV
ncbi:hypothetical protein JCM21900_002267 [Sporobolomyces salmonicolor]